LFNLQDLLLWIMVMVNMSITVHMDVTVFALPPGQPLENPATQSYQNDPHKEFTVL
jgi:hypothetical protein